MKKLLSLIMISLSWIIGMVAVFSFDPAISSSKQITSVHAVFDISQEYAFDTSSSNYSVEIPSFKIDWKLFGKLNSELELFSRTILAELSLQEYLKKTMVLFDIKSLFIHFFYPQ